MGKHYLPKRFLPTSIVEMQDDGTTTIYGIDGNIMFEKCISISDMILSEDEWLSRIGSHLYKDSKFDYWLVFYNDKEGNQVVKPFFDDEGGQLTEVAIGNVYKR